MQIQRCIRARRLAALVIGVVALPVLAGCSSSSSSGLFPAVLDRPAQREDAPLSPDQVKQAMDNLVAERNRLCAEAATNGNPAAGNCGADNTGGAGAAQPAGGAAKP